MHTFVQVPTGKYTCSAYLPARNCVNKMSKHAPSTNYPASKYESSQGRIRSDRDRTLYIYTYMNMVYSIKRTSELTKTT